MKWRLQQAKRQFGKVVQAAMEQEPQTITLHDKEAAVMLYAEEYRRLIRQQQPDFTAQTGSMRDLEGLLSPPDEAVTVEEIDEAIRKRASLRSLANHTPDD